MPLFSYRAINDDNTEVRGSLESSDEQNARKALEDLSLEVLDIAEATRSHDVPVAAVPAEQVPVFAFEGKDASGTVRRGTLQATNKYEAFKSLRDQQKLFLMMLSPIGTLPQYNDPELTQWQRGVKDSAREVSSPKVGFTNTAQGVVKPTASPIAATSERYYPLTVTLRLYAGWLLAWYGLCIIIGYYAVARSLPWDIPFVKAFFLSPLVFRFIAALILFLVLTSLHQRMKGKLLSGIILSVAGIGLLYLL